MRMPFLSNMTSARRVITHSDDDGQYVVTVMPKAGLVAAFGLTLFSDAAWPDDELESEDFRASTAGVVQMQRIKALHPSVFAELKRIQGLAERHGVPRENVLLVDCSLSAPDEVAAQAREAFERDAPFSAMRSNALWPTLANKVGLHLTDVFIDEIWDMEDRGELI